MTKMASQITSLAVVYSTVYSDADQRKHQRSAGGGGSKWRSLFECSNLHIVSALPGPDTYICCVQTFVSPQMSLALSRYSTIFSTRGESLSHTLTIGFPLFPPEHHCLPVMNKSRSTQVFFASLVQLPGLPIHHSLSEQTTRNWSTKLNRSPVSHYQWIIKYVSQVSRVLCRMFSHL